MDRTTSVEVAGVAIPEHRTTDLWAHVQQRALRDLPTAPLSNVRVLPTPRTIRICADEPGWHATRHQARADELVGALEAAVASGSERRAARLRAGWLHQLHLDRVAAARAVAQERRLRLDPIGRGPLVHTPVVHYRDRLPWGLLPLDRLSPDGIPDRAAAVMSEWNGSGRLFDVLYVADEPTSSSQLPVRSLIGAISSDGRTADWFVLDRWAL